MDPCDDSRYLMRGCFIPLPLSLPFENGGNWSCISKKARAEVSCLLVGNEMSTDGVPFVTLFIR